MITHIGNVLIRRAAAEGDACYLCSQQIVGIVYIWGSDMIVCDDLGVCDSNYDKDISRACRSMREAAGHIIASNGGHNEQR